MKSFLFIILISYSFLAVASSRDSLYAEFEDELKRLETSSIASDFDAFTDEVSSSQAAGQILNAEDVVIIPLPGMEDDELFNADGSKDSKGTKRVKSRN